MKMCGVAVSICRLLTSALAHQMLTLEGMESGYDIVWGNHFENKIKIMHVMADCVLVTFVF